MGCTGSNFPLMADWNICLWKRQRLCYGDGYQVTSKLPPQSLSCAAAAAAAAEDASRLLPPINSFPFASHSTLSVCGAVKRRKAWTLYPSVILGIICDPCYTRGDKKRGVGSSRSYLFLMRFNPSLNYKLCQCGGSHKTCYFFHWATRKVFNPLPPPGEQTSEWFDKSRAGPTTATTTTTTPHCQHSSHFQAARHVRLCLP